MTREQLQKAWPILEAFKDGRELECKLYDEWRTLVHQLNEANLCKYPEKYRIKPTLKLRPWKPEEVPIGALIKPIDNKLTWVSMILSKSYDRIAIHGGGFNTEFALENHLHSLDHGKTWLPCGVEE